MKMRIRTPLLGTNPLMGVDHLAREYGRERLLKSNAGRIAQIIRIALTSGAEGVTFSNEPSMREALSILRRTDAKLECGVYPLIPDTRAYTNTLVQHGVRGLALEVLGSVGWGRRIRAIAQSGFSLASSDIRGLIRAYLRIEVESLTKVLPFGSSIDSLLVHEFVTDMGVGMGSYGFVEAYCDILKEDFDIRPGFVTRNLPRFLEVLSRTNVDPTEILIMSPVNKIGFQMHPTKKAVEDALLGHPTINVIGISILAAGRLGLEESIDYVRNFPAVKSLAIGVSTSDHARETFSALKGPRIQ